VKIAIATMLILCASLSGCTDATMSSFGALGSEAEVSCYSGGQRVFNDKSTGKVVQTDNGDGLGFRSKSTGKFVRVYADCIVIAE
jgi:hypothetical protein